MQIFKITILQYPEDYSQPCREFYELYEDVHALRRAWNEMNAENLFGPVVRQDVTPCWESDPFCSSKHKDGKWITELSCGATRPKTENDLRSTRAFNFDRNPAFSLMHTI